MSFKLDPKKPVTKELVRVMREESADTLAAVASRRTSAHDRIHRARTGTKKLRAALRLVRGADTQFARRANRRLARAARELSPLRDADAMLESLAALLKHFASSVQPDHYQPVRHALLAFRRDHRRSATELQRTFREFIASLRTFDGDVAARDFEFDFASLATAIQGCYKRARTARKAAAVKPTADTFHKWRKATKAYAYQCQLLRAAWPPAMKELRNELKALANRLGDEHDLNVLEALLEELHGKRKLKVEEEVFRALLGLIAARRQELRDEALPLGRRIFADRAAAVTARLRKWWDVAAAMPLEVSIEPTV
jgi:CHAD domain-containing protein